MKPAVTLLALATAILIGCDKPKQAAAPPATQQVISLPDLTTRPTTQQILAAPTASLTLDPLPLTIDVSQYWKIQVLPTSNFLSGPAPVGDIFIRYSEQHNSMVPRGPTLMGETPDPARDLMTYTQVEVDDIIKAAQQSAARDPAQFKTPIVRQSQSARILERQQVDGDSMHWTITVYAPKAGRFKAYELSFIGLTPSMYDADAEYLNPIIASLRYDVALEQTTRPTIP